MGEIEAQAITGGATAAESRGCLNKVTEFLPSLLKKVRSLRRRQALVLFATLVVLLVVIQTNPSTFVRELRSVGPSDIYANVFEQKNTSTSEKEIERWPKNRSQSSETKIEKNHTIGPNADLEREGSTSKSEERSVPATPKSSNERPVDDPEDILINLHTGNRAKDVGYERTKCFSTSGKPQNHTCAPAVVIAGYEKCGTSALYYKLTKHPEIVAHASWKENCPSEDSLEAMWAWFENKGTPVLENSTADGLLLNGCIGIVSKPTILGELQRLNPNLKVLATFRNYADWAYSFYGYRCYGGFDKGCEKLEGPAKYGPWKETRNPHNFAKLVNETVQAGKSPYQAFGVIEPNVNLFRQWLEELVEIVGRDAVKIVKQEDLAFSPRETLGVVAEFVGIDAARFEDEAYSLVSNTNDQPAVISSIEENSSMEEISAVVNSGSGIFDETRVELDKFWKGECEWLRDEFDVHYTEVC